MTPTLVAIIAAVAAPLGAYLVAARRFSGRIENSDATDLWEESRAIRTWSKEQIDALSERVRRLEESNAGLAEENRDLRGQVRNLTSKLERANARIAELEAPE